MQVGYDDISNTPLYGVSNDFKHSPYANLVGNGYYTEQTRTGASNVALEYDMSSLVKGLKSKTYLGVNILNLTRLGKAENYIAYIPSFKPDISGADSLVLGRVSEHTGFDMVNQVKLYDFYAHNYKMFQNFTYERTFGNHDIQSSLTYFISKVVLNDTQEPRRLQNGVWSTNYSFRNKYILQGVLNYAGTYAFDKGNRYAMFPAAGVAWVISDESFMSGVKAINYLKLRAEYGTIGYESFMSPFRFRDDWNVNNTGAAFGPISNFTRWFGTN
ncbi:MAG: SusC/RagA family TonB-linked outer membrane protein, partial [Bacteroidetes bacterium]|nr:SusC/RagA family TonB-linked outer membrane protein [Bacteroidota bacterium]